MTPLQLRQLPGPSQLTRLQRLEAACPLFLEMARCALRQANAQQDRDRLAQANLVGAEPGGSGPRDFGPVIRVARNEVVGEYRADPDPKIGSLIHGGRVQDGLHAMYRRKHITIQQWHAACRFRDDLDLAAGVRLDRPDNLGIRSAPSSRNWPDETQIASLVLVRELWTALSEPQVDIAHWMVVGGNTVAEYAVKCRKRRITVSELLQSALDAIVEFYDRRD